MADQPNNSAHAALTAELQAVAERLRSSEQRLAFALESGQLGIWDWDVASGRVVHASIQRSPQGDAPLYQESDAAEWAAQVHADDLVRVSVLLRHVVDANPERYTVVIRLRATDDEPYRHVEVRGKTVARDPDGRPLRIVGTYEDVTDRVQRERQLKQHEAAVANTDRLALLGEVAAGLAHEINQPLGALLSYIGAAERMLRSEPSPRADVLDALRQCAQLAEKAAEIVRRHRRMIQRKAPLDEGFELHALVREVLLLLEADARADDVALTTSFDGSECAVVADRIQIEQVLVNLVRNAVEALREHAEPHRAVSVSTRRTERRVEVRVTDNGPGIAEAVRDQVFDPFFTTKDEGAGLGLSISRRIAQAHDGNLGLEESGPGRTTFVLELPLSHERHHSQRRTPRADGLRRR